MANHPSSTHREFGETNIQMPRVVFGATALGNLFVAMRDQAKAELIRQWFVHAPKPIAIDGAGKYGAGLALEVIARELGNLAVSPEHVILINQLAWRRVPPSGPEPTFEKGIWLNLEHDAVQDISYDGILRCHDEGCQFLGDYKPQLVSVQDPDEYLAGCSDPEERKKRLDDILGAYRALAELRAAGEIIGVGIGAKDWRVIRELDRACELDWIMMANSLTVMNHPPDLIEFVDSLESRKIPLINSALTHGGFLVGGNHFDYRRINFSNTVDAMRMDWRENFDCLCEQFGQTPYEVCVAFGGAHSGVTSLALSTSNPKRVETMVQSAFAEIPREFWQAMVDSRMVLADFGSRFLL